MLFDPSNLGHDVAADAVKDFPQFFLVVAFMARPKETEDPAKRFFFRFHPEFCGADIGLKPRSYRRRETGNQTILSDFITSCKGTPVKVIGGFIGGYSYGGHAVPP